jgi:hypothetical protein
MWIFTRDFGSHNLDNYDYVEVRDNGTFLIQWGNPSCCVSRSDVEKTIRDAIRRGEKFVEVE